MTQGSKKNVSRKKHHNYCTALDFLPLSRLSLAQSFSLSVCVCVCVCVICSLTHTLCFGYFVVRSSRLSSSHTSRDRRSRSNHYLQLVRTAISGSDRSSISSTDLSSLEVKRERRSCKAAHTSVVVGRLSLPTSTDPDVLSVNIEVSKFPLFCGLYNYFCTTALGLPPG